MGDLTAEYNADLNKIADLRCKGEKLDPLDEQRLRDHQLRRLRRLWLKDLNLSPREPLVAPKKLNWIQRLGVMEEAFWSKRLQFRTNVEYVYHGKNFRQLPLLWVYQIQRSFRTSILRVFVPALPLFYWLKYADHDMPGLAIATDLPIYPGDEFKTVRRGDVKFDRRTFQFVPVENEDDWKRVLL